MVDGTFPTSGAKKTQSSEEDWYTRWMLPPVRELAKSLRFQNSLEAAPPHCTVKRRIWTPSFEPAATANNQLSCLGTRQSLCPQRAGQGTLCCYLPLSSSPIRDKASKLVYSMLLRNRYFPQTAHNPTFYIPDRSQDQQGPYQQPIGFLLVDFLRSMLVDW